MRLPALPPKLKKSFAVLHWAALGYMYGFLLVKATLQFSRPADVLAFHLPRALRYFGLTTYEYGSWAMRQADGMPPLPNMIQGFMICITGQVNAVNAVNAVGFAAAMGGIYWLYGKKFPYRWFLTFCLSVPLFLYHMTIGFIDLFSACMVLLAFVGLHGMNTNHKPFSSGFVLVFGCTLAMLSKMTVWPATYAIAAFGIVALSKDWGTVHMKKRQILMLGTLLVLGVAYFPLRNFIAFGNPTYPIELKPYMKTLPAVAVVSQTEEVNIPSSLTTKNQALEFGYSLLEMNRVSNIPLSWPAFQEHGRPFERDQMGGFFFLTVVVMGLTLFLVYSTHPTSTLSFGAYATCLVIVANMPHSSVLRYFLFLPLIGLYLLCAHLPVLKKPLRHLIQGGLLACVLFVLPNLGEKFWTLDLRHYTSFAPTAARVFWTDNEGKTFDGQLVIEGAYPSTIYWAGPDFRTWNVREELDNRYVNTIRPAVPK